MHGIVYAHDMESFLHYWLFVKGIHQAILSLK